MKLKLSINKDVLNVKQSINCGLFSGETLAQGKDTHVTREAIEELRYNLKKVLHFIDDLSGDIPGGNRTTGTQCQIII